MATPSMSLPSLGGTLLPQFILGEASRFHKQKKLQGQGPLSLHGSSELNPLRLQCIPSIGPFSALRSIRSLPTQDVTLDQP